MASFLFGSADSEASGGTIGLDRSAKPAQGRPRSHSNTNFFFRLRNKGVTPIRGGSVGDLLCRVVIETPVNLTKRQKEILEEFQTIYEAEGERQSPRRSSWFDGVKKFVDGLRA